MTTTEESPERRQPEEPNVALTQGRVNPICLCSEHSTLGPDKSNDSTSHDTAGDCCAAGFQSGRCLINGFDSRIQSGLTVFVPVCSLQSQRSNRMNLRNRALT